MCFHVLSQSCNLARDGISPPADWPWGRYREEPEGEYNLSDGGVGGWVDDVNIFLILSTEMKPEYHQ